MAAGDKAGALQLTPVMQQYVDIKRQHEDAILFFRMGDFYEMFFEDAVVAAGILDIALTSRNRNDPDPIPMCGVPYHSMRPYVARLLEAGRRVALCEQVEMPSGSSKLARRAVTRVVTPGTTLDEETLAPERANYLACVLVDGDDFGVAVTDFSTGEVRATQLAGVAALMEELAALAPREILTDAGDKLRARIGEALPGCFVDGLRADLATAEPDPGLPLVAGRAHAVLVAFVAATQGGATAHLRAPVLYQPAGFLRLDEATRRNLEILESARGGVRGSLVWALDRSSTAMGKRLLRRWLLAPLADAEAIGRRLDAVEALVEEAASRQVLRDALRAVGDLERLAGRIGARTASPRDVLRLAESLAAVARTRELLAAAGFAGRGALAEASASMDPMPQVRARIEATLAEEPPPVATKGGLIRDGFHEEVDRLRSISRDGKGWIARFEAAERERTGIAKLKVGFNRVFGYYIEISKTSVAQAPGDYVRKQTTAGAERYITEALKVRESEVLGAEERLATLEAHLFAELVAELGQAQEGLGRTAQALACVDVLAGLAETAHVRGFVRPQLHDGAELVIVEGRHPVVELATGDRFVPNDTRLGPDSATLVVITGPNMAGKSTYLRQVALVALLAHIGSYVPATEARIPLVDRIFTRIGASDDLARGQSTFMVEMAETANILRNMTERSLVVLDEIGRGTSTFDGISIAWAVAEAMIRRRAKTLFATHYHELAGLAGEHGAVANQSVAVRRWRGEVVFLYRVVDGPTSGSYGIEVARLAGVPEDVIARARSMLERFETGQGLGAASQLSLFAPQAAGRAAGGDEGPARALLERLAALEIDALSPLEALNLLAGLVAEARDAQ